jgi:signal transduction histidine kinase/DNA-binding LacI/PurR family transcriptional regulator
LGRKRRPWERYYVRVAVYLEGATCSTEWVIFIMEYVLQTKPRKKKRFTIGFLDENTLDEYHSFMTEGIFEAAGKYGINAVRFGHISTRNYKYNSYIDMALDHILQYELDGLLFLGWATLLTTSNHEYFKKRFHSIPLISLGSTWENVPSVYFHGETYIRELLLHLINVHGIKKIAFIAPFSPDGRCHVYQTTMKEYGIYNPDLFIDETELNLSELPERGRKAVSILLDKRKVAVNAIISLFNDETRAVLEELQLRGIRVPQDIALTSYEDGEAGRFASPALTTIYFPWKEIGYFGCEKMYELLTRGHIPLLTTVPGRVILRDSCGCISEPVRHAHPGKIKAAGQSLAEVSGYTLFKIRQELSQKVNSAILDLDDLIKAFVNDYYHQSNRFFLPELELQLRNISDHHNYTAVEDVISVLRGLMLPYLVNEWPSFLWAENIFQQAQVLVQEKKEIVWSNMEVKSDGIHLTIQEIGQMLVTQFNLADILDSLGANLPRINIPSCYIFIFRNKSAHDNPFEDYELVFKYHNGGYTKPKNTEAEVTKHRLPRIIFPENKSYSMMAQLLHVANEYIGFVVFESDPVDESIYRILGLNISTALSDAILLEKLNNSYKKLVEQAHREGMMAMVTGILHNISNVLNSISVSSHLIRDLIYTSPIDDYNKANQLLMDHLENLNDFICLDPKGKKLMQFYTKLGEPFRELQIRLQDNINRLDEKVKLINDIIITQQGYIGIKSTLEETEIVALVEDVLKINLASLEKHRIKISRNYQDIPKIKVHKTKLFYVLVNLIKNAQDAMVEVPETQRQLSLVVERDCQYKYIKVSDTGSGISPDLLQSVFAYGYTTKKGGHGFGLHSCANYMTEMGAKIWAESAGPGKGATFVLQFK